MIRNIAAKVIISIIHVITGARALWEGTQPAAGKRVYYGNHASHGDFVMIWSALPPKLRPHVRPVAGADYWNKDALRRYIIHKVFRGVLIERDPAKRTEDAITTLVRAIDEGNALILFPEGTRNTEDGLLPFKSGIYHIAQQRPDVEFVPVWLDNLKRAIPKGRVLPLPLLCTARVGAPVVIKGGEGKDEFLSRARTALLDLADENDPARLAENGDAK